MQIEKHENNSPILPNKETTMLQKIQHGLQKILGKNRSPEEIYTFLAQLQNIARNEFLSNQDLYKQQEDSQLFVDKIKSKVIEYTKKDTYFTTSEFMWEDSHNFLTSSTVNGISPDDIQKIHADRIHPINPSKYYAVNGISFILKLAKDDIPKFMKATIPVNTNLVKNGMTFWEEQYRYLQLGDIMIKYLPYSNEFHVDFITLIKETIHAGKDCYDGWNYRKLVWIAKPFPEVSITNTNLLEWTQ